MPAFNPIPGVVVLAGAAAVGFGMRRFGSRQTRQYAVAAAGAILIVGLDFVYELPLYAYLAGILLAPFLYHKRVRTRLQAAVDALEPIELGDLGIRLVRRPSSDPSHVAVWRAQALSLQADPTASIMGRSAQVEAVQAESKPDSLVVALSFVGEMDDDYEVILYGESPKEVGGEVVLFHHEAVGYFTSFLADEEIGHLPGAEAWMTVRAKPVDFGMQLLDARALAALHEVFQLQSEERQMFTAVQGRRIKIVSTRSFSKDELPQFVGYGARWIQKVRESDFGKAGPA